MEVGYRDAIDQLQAMFQDCDENTIKSVLRANQGHMEKTIEDLLKMTAEAENDDNDDNLFAETNPRTKPRSNRNEDLFGIDDEPRGNRFEDLGIFGENNQSRSKLSSNNREQQEKADAELAYRLQKEEIAHEKEMERQEAMASRSGSRNNAGGWNFAQSNSQPSTQYSNQAGQESGEKKKTGLVSKVKAGISSVFGKKKGKKGPTQNPGQYAEIDNLDDQQEIYNFNGGGSQSTGLHQFQGNKQNDDYDDAPMQLSDILNPKGMSNIKNDDSDEDDNYGNRNRNNQGVNNEHFGFH